MLLLIGLVTSLFADAIVTVQCDGTTISGPGYASCSGADGSFASGSAGAGSITLTGGIIGGSLAFQEVHTGVATASEIFFQTVTVFGGVGNALLDYVGGGAGFGYSDRGSGTGFADIDGQNMFEVNGGCPSGC